MASAGVKARRAAASVPFLLIAAWCFRTMDIDKLVLNQQPFVDSGVIEWDGGKVTILDHFHHVDILDTIWRGTMATFSPSTFGYDSIASWQMFSFLTDLGPVYAVWILESYRPANAWTPAYFPTFFSLAGQLLGLGSVAPFFYFLCFAFGPTASELSRSPVQNRTVRQGVSGLLLPIVFLFHTAEVFAMFLAPEYTTRHFWTWAWQLSPFWIGITHLVLSKTIARPQAASKASSSTLATPLKTLLLVLGTTSAAVWGYTLVFSPHSLPTIFLPAWEPQTEFVAHCRTALQADNLAVFGSSLLWLVYSSFDLYTAGLLGGDWILHVLLLPVITAFAGSGAALVFGWYLREKALASPTKK